MPLSTYPNGFMDGVTIRGMPINTAYPGKVVFLNNSTVLPDLGIAGSDGNPGNYLAPCATLVGAMGKCRAGRGDVIAVMPNHAETVSTATGMVLNVSNIAVVGMGAGNLRPTFTLGTATTATIGIQAACISFVNCIFKANFAAIASLFTLTNAPSFALSNCLWKDNSSILNFVNIIKTDTTSNHADNISLENCERNGAGATSATCVINMLGTNDKLNVVGNYIAHSATTQAGFMPIATGKVVTNMVLKGNTFNLIGSSSATTGVLITTDGSTNSGAISNNYTQSLDDTSPILVTASSGFKYYNNYYSSVADTSGFLLPAVGT